MRTAEIDAAFLLPHIKKGMRILDTGCGPETITVGLAGYAEPGEVIGIDQADEIVDHARAYARDKGVANVRFETASIYDLPFQDADFDIAYAHQLLQHLAAPVAALREISRILRPGAILAVRDADYGTMTHHPHDPLLDRWFEIYHQVARANGGEPDAGRGCSVGCSLQDS